MLTRRIPCFSIKKAKEHVPSVSETPQYIMVFREEQRVAGEPVGMEITVRMPQDYGTFPSMSSYIDVEYDYGQQIFMVTLLHLETEAELNYAETKES